MAEESARRTYPRLPAKNWWALRERFRQTVPRLVDADYLQSVLGLSSTASAGNLIGPLRTLGLIDDDGRPTERAQDWRLDDSYEEVCEAILSDVYPDSLRSAFPDPSADSTGVTAWFSRNTGSGQGAASGMASLYALIAEADPAGAAAVATTGAAAKKKAAPRKAPPGPASGRPARATEAVVENRQRRAELGLNINIQIHISSDASAEQIDKIFQSMAEHLYADD